MFAFILLTLLFKKNFSDFGKAAYIISSSFMVCYTIYFILPVAGPRIALAPAVDIPHNGYLFPKIVNYLFEHGNVPNAAFPSSHCAMATVNTLVVWKFIKKARLPFTIIAFLLVLSTVYCRYHYLVDSIAGIITGVICFSLFSRFVDMMIKNGYLWNITNKITSRKI
jgi:membrane-associated phospholipid phosphatase